MRPTRDLARTGIATISLKLVQVALALGVSVLLARSLGPTEYGTYSFVLALATVLVVPCQCGLPAFVLRETAAAEIRQDWPTLMAVWEWSNRFVLVVSPVLLGVVASLAWAFTDTAHFTSDTLLWGLALVPVLALLALRSASLRGLHHVVLGQIVDSPLRLGLLMAFVLFLSVFLPSLLTSSSAMAFHVLAASLALIVATCLLRRSRPPLAGSCRRLDYKPRVWLASAIPLGLLAAAQIVNTRADAVLLGLLAGPKSVGIYQVAVQGATVVQLGLTAINLVLAPRIAALFATDQTEELQRLITSSARLVVVITAVFLLALVATAAPLIRLAFGLDYIPATGPLLILTIGQLFNAGFGSVGLLLNMTRHETSAARGFALAAAANIALNLVLIPRFGIHGAAVATAVALALWNLLLWREARRLVGIDTLAFPIRSVPAQRG